MIQICACNTTEIYWRVVRHYYYWLILGIIGQHHQVLAWNYCGIKGNYKMGFSGLDDGTGLSGFKFQISTYYRNLCVYFFFCATKMLTPATQGIFLVKEEWNNIFKDHKTIPSIVKHDILIIIINGHSIHQWWQIYGICVTFFFFYDKRR